MSCEQILGQLCDDLSEDIDSDVCQKIREHLESCVECSAQLASMKNTVHLFRCMEQTNVPDGVKDRLHKMLNIG